MNTLSTSTQYGCHNDRLDGEKNVINQAAAAAGGETWSDLQSKYAVRENRFNKPDMSNAGTNHLKMISVRKIRYVSDDVATVLPSMKG